MFMWKNLTRTRKKRDRDTKLAKEAKSSEETKEGDAEDDDAGDDDAEERGETEETKGRRPYEDEADALLHEFWLERKASAVGGRDRPSGCPRPTDPRRPAPERRASAIRNRVRPRHVPLCVY